MTLRNRVGLETSAARYKAEVLADVEQVLDDVLSAYRQPNSGVTVAIEKMTSAEFAQHLLAGLPILDATNPMADLIGPCYDTVGVQQILGRARGSAVSKQAVEARRERRSILALRTSDGRWVYPVFQFADGSVRKDLATVLHTLGESPSWTAATWLRTPHVDLDRLSPLAWLDDGRPLTAVTRAAAQAAARWAA